MGQVDGVGPSSAAVMGDDFCWTVLATARTFNRAERIRAELVCLCRLFHGRVRRRLVHGQCYCIPSSSWPRAWDSLVGCADLPCTFAAAMAGTANAPEVKA